MERNETDEEIIRLYKSGEKEVFKVLIDRYATHLYNFTARLGNKNDAPDIVQEVFIKVWKNIRRFDPKKASFKTWIFTIAKNSATDFLRKKRNVLFSDLEGEREVDSISFAENIQSEEVPVDEALQKVQDKMADKEFLDTILEKLPADYRAVLLLYYQEEMTFDDIGKVLNKPLNTVKSQHRRAILKIKEIIGS